MKIKYAAKTDTGKKRDHNEDSFGVYTPENLFFVCDGMGGHAAGDYASQKVVDTIKDLMKKSSSKGWGDLIVKIPPRVPKIGRMLCSMIMIANRRLFKLAMMYPKLRGMGTTVAGVMFEQGFTHVVNVGDSRVYRYRKKKLAQISVDHSWVEEMVEDGEIAKEEVHTFREKNVITRALGTTPHIKVDWRGVDSKDGDIFLICSDGLCGEVSDDKISKILEKNKKDIDRAASELIKAANDAGGSDNITVILSKVEKKETIDSPVILMDEIFTLSAGEQLTARIDNFIDKVYPPSKTKVPKGVKKEKRKFLQNPVTRSIIIILIIFAGLMLVKKPWENRFSSTFSAEKKSDIIIKTKPPGATVSLYSGEELIDEKVTPADFLSLNVGKYRLEITKKGYERENINVSAQLGEQNVKTVNLKEKAKMQITLGMPSGFSPEAKIYLNDKLCEYYGDPLTVKRVGIVGKTLNVDRGKTHYLRVGNKTKKIEVSHNTRDVKVILRQGKIIVQ
ncbi:MAG: Stp1/IreP family PP2C-type Ser/Thr phosphatase [Elusimicrobiota bacterium]